MKKDTTLHGVINLLLMLKVEDNSAYLTLENYLVKLNKNRNGYDLIFYDSNGKKVLEFYKVSPIFRSFNERTNYVILIPLTNKPSDKQSVIYSRNGKIKIIENLISANVRGNDCVEITTNDNTNTIRKILFNVKTEKAIPIDNSLILHNTQNFVLLSGRKFIKMYDSNGKCIFKDDPKNIFIADLTDSSEISKVKIGETSYLILDKKKKVIKIDEQPFSKILSYNHNNFNVMYGDHKYLIKLNVVKENKKNDVVLTIIDVDNNLESKNININKLMEVFEALNPKNVVKPERTSITQALKTKKFLSFLYENITPIYYGEDDFVLSVNHVGIFDSKGNIIQPLSKWELCFPMISRKAAFTINSNDIDKLSKIALSPGGESYTVKMDTTFELNYIDMESKEKIKIGEISEDIHIFRYLQDYNKNKRVPGDLYSLQNFYPFDKKMSTMFYYAFPFELTMKGKINFNSDLENNKKYCDIRKLVKIDEKIKINLVDEDDFLYIKRKTKSKVLLGNVNYCRFDQQNNRKIAFFNIYCEDSSEISSESKDITKLMEKLRNENVDIAVIRVKEVDEKLNIEQIKIIYYCDLKKGIYSPILLPDGKILDVDVAFYNDYMRISIIKDFESGTVRLPLINLNTLKIFEQSKETTNFEVEKIDINHFINQQKNNNHNKQAHDVSL